MELIYYLNELLDSARIYRIGPFSLIDTAGAYLLALVCAPLIIKLCAKIRVRVTTLEILSLTLPTALIFHLIFGIASPFTQMFLDPKNLAAKIILVAMLLFGIKGFFRRDSRSFR